MFIIKRYDSRGYTAYMCWSYMVKHDEKNGQPKTMIVRGARGEDPWEFELQPGETVYIENGQGQTIDSIGPVAESEPVEHRPFKD